MPLVVCFILVGTVVLNRLYTGNHNKFIFKTLLCGDFCFPDCEIVPGDIILSFDYNIFVLKKE